MGSREDDDYWNDKHDCDCDECSWCGLPLDDNGLCPNCEEEVDD